MEILFILVFFSVTAGVAGAFFLLAPSKTRRRLDVLVNAPGQLKQEKKAGGIGEPTGRLAMFSARRENAPLRGKFIHAGFSQGDYWLIYSGAQMMLAMSFAGSAYLLLNKTAHGLNLMLAVYMLLAASAGALLPRLVLDWKIRQRQREIREAFPDIADLLLICIEAGLGLDPALDKVTQESRKSSAVLAEELHLCRLEMHAGGTREQALKNLAMRTGVEEISSFVTMLNQADRLGVSIGDSLRIFSDDLRHQRRTRAEELAAKVPTKMLFPLVMCIFPATLLVLLGPAVIRIIRTLKPLISG